MSGTNPSKLKEIEIGDKEAQFGYRLTELIEGNCLKRAEIAKGIGKDKVAIYQWERGRNVKQIMKFFALCEYFNVTPDYFYNGKRD